MLGDEKRRGRRGGADDENVAEDVEDQARIRKVDTAEYEKVDGSLEPKKRMNAPTRCEYWQVTRITVNNDWGQAKTKKKLVEGSQFRR
jgi:hypothetical protein